MPRDIDERKKRKALRKLRKAAALAEQGLGPELSDWEKQFLEEVEQRIETYGSAFADLDKGAADEPLSALQTVKLREIDKKARGKGKSGFKTRKPLGAKSRARRDESEDVTGDPPPPAEPAPLASAPKLISARDLPAPAPPTAPSRQPGAKRPALRVIKGGADET